MNRLQDLTLPYPGVLTYSFARIAIDGSHSTGKTTLLQRLANRLELNQAFTFLGEAARAMASSAQLFTPEDWEHLFHHPQQHQRFQQGLYAFQKRQEEAHIPFMVDGSLYKIMAYAEHFGFDQKAIGVNLVEASYDLILYCPLEIDFVADGFRYADHRREVDGILRKLLQKFHKGRLVEVHGSVEARVDQILAVLRAGRLERRPAFEL